MELLVEVVREGDEAGGTPKDVRVGGCEPGELRGPEARMQMGAGSRMDGRRIEAPAKPPGRLGAAGVAPPQHRRQRPPRAVERHQAMPEARCPDRVDPLVAAADHLADQAYHLLGIPAVVALLPPLVDRIALLVEALRAHGGRADVEREHGRHAANLPW